MQNAEAHTARVTQGHNADRRARAGSLYTPEQRRRRDRSVWTLVQGILAPLQFVVFLVSLALVARYLVVGDGLAAAHISIVVKTLVLYTIMVTGAIWEKEVFGQYLFAPAFYWEDVFSMLVLALHTAYLVALFSGWLGPTGLMYLALAAYATYVINAGQFLLKLRAARLERPEPASGPASEPASGPALTQPAATHQAPPQQVSWPTYPAQEVAR